jgi:hypothetical protein
MSSCRSPISEDWNISGESEGAAITSYCEIVKNREFTRNC